MDVANEVCKSVPFKHIEVAVKLPVVRPVDILVPFKLNLEHLFDFEYPNYRI